MSNIATDVLAAQVGKNITSRTNGQIGELDYIVGTNAIALDYTFATHGDFEAWIYSSGTTVLFKETASGFEIVNESQSHHYPVDVGNYTLVLFSVNPSFRMRTNFIEVVEPVFVEPALLATIPTNEQQTIINFAKWLNLPVFEFVEINETHLAPTHAIAAGKLSIFKLTLPESKKVTAHTGLSFDTVIMTIDLNGMVVASNDDIGNGVNNSYISQDLAAGVYFAAFYGYGGQGGVTDIAIYIESLAPVAPVAPPVVESTDDVIAQTFANVKSYIDNHDEGLRQYIDTVLNSTDLQAKLALLNQINDILDGDNATAGFQAWQRAMQGQSNLAQSVNALLSAQNTNAQIRAQDLAAIDAKQQALDAKQAASFATMKTKAAQLFAV